MTAENPLTAAVGAGVPLLVLSPHLDDAVLSCGALMIHALPRTEITVVTLFTEAGPPPHTLSARQFLRQVGARDAQELYRERREEDREVLEKLGVRCVHAGLAEALFRLRAGRLRHALGRVLPELSHLYPVYRWQITSGRIAPGDGPALREACDVIGRLAGPGPALVLAPLGVGAHVDHVLTRTAADQSGAPVVYYSDFPHNQRHSADAGFVQRNSLVAARWTGLLEAKAGLIRGYRTQVDALFPAGRIPLVPEVYLFPWAPGGPGPGERG